MSIYTETATIKDLDRMEYQWQPTFQAKIDDKGKWTGSESFICRLKDVTRLLPTIGARCTLEGWEFLTSTTAEVENIEGDLAEVTISYSSYEDAQFGFGDSNLNNYIYDLQVQTQEEPLLSHWRSTTTFGNMTTDEKNALRKVVDGTWERTENTSEYKVYDVADTTKSLTITSSDGIEFLTRISTGVTGFLSPKQVWRITYTTKSRPGKSEIKDVGKIVTPKGAPTYANRNWLFQGLTVNEKDKIFTITEEYVLSEVGNWDSYLYEDGNDD